MKREGSADGSDSVAERDSAAQPIEPQAADMLLPQVYEELRRLAAYARAWLFREIERQRKFGPDP